MNGSELTSCLVFSPGKWCGRVVLVLHQEHVQPDVGMLWMCRSLGQDKAIADTALFALDLRGDRDPGARELLSEADQIAWDAWWAPPDVDL